MRPSVYLVAELRTIFNRRMRLERVVRLSGWPIHFVEYRVPFHFIGNDNSCVSDSIASVFISHQRLDPRRGLKLRGIIYRWGMGANISKLTYR